MINFWSGKHENIAIARNWTESTKEEYNNIIVPILTDFPFTMSTVTFSDMLKRCEQFPTARGALPSVNTIKKRLTILHDMFIYAAYTGDMPNIFKYGSYSRYLQDLKALEKSPASKSSKNVTEARKHLVSGRRKHNLRRSLSIDEMVALTKNFAANVPTGAGEAVGCAVSFYLGVRPAECRALCFGDMKPFNREPNRHCMVINKIQQPDGTITDYVKTAASIRMVPIHIELETLLQRRIAFLKSVLPAGTDIDKLPIVCHEHNYDQRTIHYWFSSFASKLLKQFISRDFMDSCYLEACQQQGKDQQDAVDCLSLYCLRRNFLTCLYACSGLNDDQKKYCMGHTNRDAERKDINEIFNHPDRRLEMLPLLDQWLCNKELHQDLLVHSFADTEEQFCIQNATQQDFVIPADLAPNGCDLVIKIGKYIPDAASVITQITSPRNMESPPIYSIQHDCNIAPTKLPRLNIQDRIIDYLEKPHKKEPIV